MVSIVFHFLIMSVFEIRIVLASQNEFESVPN